MTPARGPYLSPRAKNADQFDAIGGAAHERAMMLELASTLEEWPARNIVVRRRLDLVAREIVRLASGPGSAELAGANPAPAPRELRATTPA